MLPFSIMNQYGNKVVQKEIKKVDTGGSSIALLYSTGKLYMRGTNNRGNLGTGNADNLTSWAVVQEDVVDVACGTSNTLIRKNDGTIWCAGWGYMMNLGNTSNNSFVNITSLFGVHAGNIKEIQLGLYSILFLTYDNTLYGMGYNYYGELGSPSLMSYRGPTLIASNVLKMRISANQSGYINSSSVFYRAGQNGSTYNLGTGTTTNITTFTPYTGVQAVDFKLDSYTTYVLVYNGTSYEIHNAGFGALGSLCNGSTSNKSTISKLTQFTSITSLSEQSFDIIGTTGGGNIFKGTAPGELITGGYNPSNQFGTFNVNVKNELSSNSFGVPQVLLNNCKILTVSTALCMIITPDNKVYASSSQSTDNSASVNLGIGNTNNFKYFENYLPPA